MAGKNLKKALKEIKDRKEAPQEVEAPQETGTPQKEKVVDPIEEEITLLQNDGIYRRELLQNLIVISEQLTLLNKNFSV